MHQTTSLVTKLYSYLIPAKKIRYCTSKKRQASHTGWKHERTVRASETWRCLVKLLLRWYIPVSYRLPAQVHRRELSPLLSKHYTVTAGILRCPFSINTVTRYIAGSDRLQARVHRTNELSVEGDSNINIPPPLVHRRYSTGIIPATRTSAPCKRAKRGRVSTHFPPPLLQQYVQVFRQEL